MTTDGGGWTTIQKREDGDLDFYRTWNEYKEGFGNASKNYWLGNDAIHSLSKDRNQELRIDLQSFSGEQAYAVYSTFYIGDEDNKYNLTVSGYSGTADDSLAYHNGMKFSTKFQDNDRYSTVNCAKDRLGAWWYRACTNSNLNGMYGQSGVSGKNYTTWYGFKGYEGLKQTQMMIRHKK
ncbi:ficolin-1-like [Saccostrea cucullata]|uniref:ficolin-1-like n=1 Tax=Saccostrea cuccullata TaxID=36930 RepID=UPI002ED68AD5